MAATVYEYELEYTIVHKTSRETKTLVVREWAYGIMDALHQTSLQLSNNYNDWTVGTVHRVGPPPELIATHAAVARAYEGAIARATAGFDASKPNEETLKTYFKEKK